MKFYRQFFYGVLLLSIFKDSDCGSQGSVIVIIIFTSIIDVFFEDLDDGRRGDL